MRIARILFATALMAFTALAFAATANAEHEEPITNHEEPVEVLTEAGVHCTDLSLAPVDEEPEVGGSETTGGCAVSSTGELRLRGHLFGIEQTISECDVSFSGRVDEEGEGWITEAALTPGIHGDACTLDPCEETGHMIRSWPVHVREDTGAVPDLWIAAEFCVVPKTNHASSSDRRECEVEFPVIVVGHHYSINGESLGTNHLNATNCEVDGTGEVDAGQIEIQHDHLP